MATFPSHVVNRSFQLTPRPGGNLLYELLKTSNNSFEMTVNATVNSVENFDYIVPANQIASINRVCVLVEDSGSMQLEDFGSITGGLTSGVRIQALDSDQNVSIDFVNSLGIQTNADWAILAGSDVNLTTSAGDDELMIRWTISGAGAPLELKPSERLRFTIQDSLAPLVSFRAMVQGQVFDT